MNYREILIRLMSMTTPFVYDSEESFHSTNIYMN